MIAPRGDKKGPEYMMKRVSTLRSPWAAFFLSAAVGVAAILLPVVAAGPAQANAKVKSQNCLTNPVDTSIPTPSAATNVSARKSGVESGKARVYWNVSSPYQNAGNTLIVQIVTSNGQCAKSSEMKAGQGCVKAGSQSYWCPLKKVNSGSTEFRVALWYQSGSGKSASTGPVVYSSWSNTVNVK